MSASVWSAAAALVLVALLASCGGDESPRATPATSTPAVTATGTVEAPSPTAATVVTTTPVPTVTPEVTPTPLATATAEAERARTVTPTAAATASPSPSAPPVIEYTELTLGEPRYQPPGYALFSTLRACFWNCGGERVGVVRTVFDGQSGELLVDNPLASLDEFGSYFDFEMHDGGELMAATLCLRGYCGGLNAPSDDARQELWVSSDGGATWTSWGPLEPPSWLLRVTEDDVAVEEEVRVRGGGRSAVRWIKSGKVFPEPASENPRQVGVVAWDGDVPIWGEWGAAPQPAALEEVVQWTWRELHARPGGSNVWWASEPGGPLLLLAVLDPEGVVEDVYGWPSADYVDWLVPMGDGLFAGFRIEGGYAIGRDHVNFLIDLGARTVHPLLGLPDGEEGFAEPWRAVPWAGK